jgi:hypothetical protein
MVASLAVTLEGQAMPQHAVGRPPAPPPFGRVHHHGNHPHHHARFVPFLVGDGGYGEGAGPCRDAAAFVEHAQAAGKLRGDAVEAIVDDPDDATSLLYGLRAAGYPEVELLSLARLGQGRYRAEYRLGPRDASLCS